MRTATTPLKRTPSNVPAPPIETMGAPGSDSAELLTGFRLELGRPREALRRAPQVKSAATELARSRVSKESAIHSQDYAAAAHIREVEKVLRERYQLLRTTWWVGLVEP